MPKLVQPAVWPEYKRLQTLIFESGLTIPQLIEKAGVSRVAMTAITNGAWPTLKTLWAIMRALDKNFADLGNAKEFQGNFRGTYKRKNEMAVLEYVKPFRAAHNRDPTSTEIIENVPAVPNKYHALTCLAWLHANGYLEPINPEPT